MNQPATPNSPATDEPKDSSVLPRFAAPASQLDSATVGELAVRYGRLLAEKRNADAVRGFAQGIEYYIADGIHRGIAELASRFRAAGRNAQPEHPASPTVAGSVDTPMAWAAFAENGNIRIWTSAAEEVRKLAKSVGMELVPLYTHPAPSSPTAPEPAQVQTMTLTDNQLRAALEFLAPTGPDGIYDQMELEGDLTFGVVPHRDDDGKVASGMCCWNEDTDGVLPLDDEYEPQAAPVQQAQAVPEGGEA